jgi:hypothetical protein
VKAVIALRPINRLSGEDIWRLIQLTWITAGRGHVIEDHWRKLKMPALAHLFNKDERMEGELSASLKGMNLPDSVVKAAAMPTGFVNAYRAYRNSLKKWCVKNEGVLRSVLNSASSLGANDQERFDLASKIMQLPSVSTPAQKRHMAASNLLTPLVACLDPKMRFPIINGEDGVNRRLVKLELVNHSLVDQVRGFINLIGQFGLVDAFAIDTMTDGKIDQISLKRKSVKLSPIAGGKTSLQILDESEREALQKAATVTYRNRHNKMTNRIRELLANHKLYAGTDPDCRYDVLVTNYDCQGRDLLIEAKPDADKGSLRIAIGQLLDYRRFLPNPAATDLAILTILPPPGGYVELMQDLQITPLWFSDEGCQSLAGQGKIWSSLKAQMSGGQK